ncbi:hypothetical protein ACFQPA_14220 [Halomarina halobia]|uniref:Uncharacterized protein n=1 Tax=Halomarina halobia TaxID=3033386 RepID=A0ABD6A8M1_9EURY|nr:hypothetical protein [Halomarina sp. PSR21]
MPRWRRLPGLLAASLAGLARRGRRSSRDDLDGREIPVTEEE